MKFKDLEIGDHFDFGGKPTCIKRSARTYLDDRRHSYKVETINSSVFNVERRLDRQARIRAERLKKAIRLVGS